MKLRNISIFALLLFLSNTVFSQVEGSNSQMSEAYDIANKLVKKRLQDEDPANIKVLESLKESDIIVVSGTYDHIHIVLKNMGVPFMQISREQLVSDAVKLKPHQTVFVNCPSSFPKEGAHKLEKFVKSGGQLITTDWALKYVIEEAFPNTIAHNGIYTKDDVVEIEANDTTDAIVKGFVAEKTKPVWWLEVSSYPIRILNPNKVDILVKSKQLKKRYGDEAVIVRFKHGKGEVYHMISHFFLQKSKDGMEGGDVTTYMKDLDFNSDESGYTEILEKSKSSKLNYKQVQSANTSADFLSRTIIKQAKKKNK